MRETLEFVALLDRAEEPAKNFSGGMKRRRNRNKEGELDELRVLIVDDTTLYRMIVTHALTRCGGRRNRRLGPQWQECHVAW